MTCIDKRNTILTKAVLTANSSATDIRLVLDPPALYVAGEEFLHVNSMNKEKRFSI